MRSRLFRLFKVIARPLILRRVPLVLVSNFALAVNYAFLHEAQTQPQEVQDFLSEMHAQFDGKYLDEHESLPKFISPVNADKGEIEGYAQDGHSYHKTYAPICLFYPNCTEDVVQFAKLCTKYKIEIASYNRGTSLEGGVLPTSPRCAVINFSQMSRILELNLDDRQVVVEPGIGWIDLNKHLEKFGYFFPVDPGPGAGIGGMVGTCCSGTNAVKYGTMRNWVFECEVVLADGRVIKTGNRAKKSSAGYNLTQLMCGSEGTLGMITKITVGIAPLPDHFQVVTICFDQLDQLSAAVEEIMRKELPLRSVELMDKNMVNVILERNKKTNSTSDQLKFNSNVLMLAMNANPNHVNQQISDIKDVIAKFSGYNLQYALTKNESDKLWTIRKQALWTVQQYGTTKRGNGAKVWTTDVCVPISKLAQSIQETQSEIESNGLIGPIIGHVGDGNYHIVFVVNHEDQVEWKKIQAVNHNMILRAIQVGGTCTGEHGVGIGKRQYIPIERGEEQLNLFRQIKKVFDPLGLLNPGKIFHMEGTRDHLDSH